MEFSVRLTKQWDILTEGEESGPSAYIDFFAVHGFQFLYQE